MSSSVAARQKMVDGQIRTQDVTDMRILEAMLAIPREDFLPESQRALAYLDLDLPLSGTAAGSPRYLIQPVVIARLLQALELASDDKVLVLGCGPGYTAALTARLAGKVIALECDPTLAAMARKNISALGFDNVTVESGPLADGLAGDAPYDAIVFDGATDVVPDALYRQLADGGRLAGVFATSEPPRATLVTRAQDDFGMRVLFDISTPVLPGMERRPEFVF
jgi:protein-L-isoaspartate(D-aspartate) O-methyltransferase